MMSRQEFRGHAKWHMSADYCVININWPSIWAQNIRILIYIQYSWFVCNYVDLLYGLYANCLPRLRLILNVLRAIFSSNMGARTMICWCNLVCICLLLLTQFSEIRTEFNPEKLCVDDVIEVARYLPFRLYWVKLIVQTIIEKKITIHFVQQTIENRKYSRTMASRWSVK